MCWVNIIISIVIAIVGEAIRPKQKSNTGRPAGLGDFQFPTAEAGRVIPWLAGTVKVLGPNTTASGGFRLYESYVRVKTGWWSTAKQSYGFRYYLSVQQVVCGGTIDDIVGFQVNDKMLKIKSKIITDDYIDVQVDDPAFYGDAKKDGGFFGLVRVWRGTATQGIDEVLQSVLVEGEDPLPLPGEFQISAYRYVCYLMFRDFCFGMSNNPPPVVPIVTRLPNTLGIDGGRHVIDDTAANVICAAYDLLSDSIRCMSVPAAEIDRPAFLAAAATCYDEGIGYCGMIDGSRSGKDALDDLMSYADGQVFKDPFTGLWTCKLARADYDINDLIVLDESNSRVVSRSKTDWPDTKNTITVAYVDKDKNWTNQSVTARDSANLTVLGNTVNAITQDFNGIDNVTQANFTAERSRAALSTPFVKLEIEAHGVGANLRINDVFMAKYPATKRIGQMVMRVTDIAYPNEGETTCNIQAVEDKFGVKYVAFIDVGTGGWTPPNLTPLPPAAQRLDELPYAMTPALDGKRYAMVMAARAEGVTVGYEVWQATPPTGTLAESNVSDDPTSVGDLAVALGTAGGYSAGSVVLSGVIDASYIVSAYAADYEAGKSLLWVGNELIAFKDVAANVDGTMTFSTIRRAVYDTVPGNHAIGQKVFIVSSGACLVQDLPYPADISIGVRLATTSGGITLLPSSDPLMTLIMTSRASRPYPPGRVLLNGNWPSLIASPLTGHVDLVLGWRHRGKINLMDQVVAYDDAKDYGPDAGTTYTVKVYDGATNALLYSLTGITGNATTVPGTTFTVNTILSVELTADIDGLSSQFPVICTIDYRV